MKKSTLLIYVLILVGLGVWIIFIFRPYSIGLALTPESVEKIVLKYETGALISVEISEIIVNHSRNETMLTTTANRTLIMGNATMLNIRNVTYDTYTCSLTEEDFNRLVDRLNYIFSHAEPVSMWDRRIHSPLWELNIFRTNQKRIYMVNSGNIWINEKPYTVRLPKEKNPIGYLTEVGYKCIIYGENKNDKK